MSFPSVRIPFHPFYPFYPSDRYYNDVGTLYTGRIILYTVMAAVVLLAALEQTAQASAPNVVVMIHGAGGGGWEYDRWRSVWARAGWQVIAPDLQPAHGGLDQTTFADYTAQVRSWVPHKRRRLVLVGASMGGLLALHVAQDIRPDALILVNSAPPAGVGEARPDKHYPPIVKWANGPIQDTRDSLPDGDEATIQWAAKLWRDESGAVLNAVRQGVRVPPPAVPTLVILGADDQDIPLASGLALAHWAKADTHLYAGTSHIGPLYGRRAAEIAEAARRWIQ